MIPKEHKYTPRITQRDYDRFTAMNIIEEELQRANYRYVAGVDEAGRGPLAGPVACAACILDPNRPLVGLNDSKKLSPAKRAYLFEEIKSKALSYSVVLIPAGKIDRNNILQATISGMATAIQNLKLTPDYLLTDAVNLTMPELPPYRALIGGDGKCNCIAAASIIAKETRDAYMRDLDDKFPGYNFAKHKGYGTREHYLAIQKLGITEEHRLSFLKKLNLAGSNQISSGSFAEQEVCSHLLQQGYEILARNYWLRPIGEIDIIACKKDQLLIVEVKARAGSDYLINCEQSLNPHKRDRIERLSNYFIATSPRQFKSVRTVLAACHLQTPEKIDKINYIEWL